MTRSLVLSALCAVLIAGPAGAATPVERCQAAQLTCSGKRILAKLRCRSKAKLQGTAVNPDCLDRAEKQFVMCLSNRGGTVCQDPDDAVELGAEADVQMSGVVEGVDPESDPIPDLSGVWQTRTIISIDPNGGFSIDCRYYDPNPCPHADLLAITDCQTTMVQNGTAFTQSSQCTMPPESPIRLGSFPQSASGTVNLLTGEWSLSGSVQPPGYTVYIYSSEGVYSPDGETMTGFTTAGLYTGQSLWLASTTGHRVH